MYASVHLAHDGAVRGLERKNGTKVPYAARIAHCIRGGTGANFEFGVRRQPANRVTQHLNNGWQGAALFLHRAARWWARAQPSEDRRQRERNDIRDMTPV